MKLLSLVLASSSFAQDEGSDKWVGYDYGSSSYGNFGSYGSYDTGLGAKFIHETIDNGVNGRLGNGLHCFTCHGRLRMGSMETTTHNAWVDCLGGMTELQMTVECVGDQRSCLTEERRRNGIVVEVMAGCKNPEACMYQWRRNERYMPPFHLFADQSEAATPAYFDDECALNAPLGQKHLTQRSQWESTCRHCCSAVASTGCNAPTVGGPIGFHCSDNDNCASASLSSNMFGGYSIIHIPVFMNLAMAHGRAHPGEGRNSAPEDKFIARSDMNGVALMEQADQLSTEDTDFHNRRVPLTGTNEGAFGSAGR